VTWKLDRLGRSLAHLIALVADLERREIAFHSLSEAIDTRTASGRLLFHVMGALAEFERSLISERTRAGIAAARYRGAAIGRPPKLSTAQVEAASAEISSGRLSLSELAVRFDVSPLTLSRAICRLL
jgi:DNA invertase Pin-like site-specific DNA recombinase